MTFPKLGGGGEVEKVIKNTRVSHKILDIYTHGVYNVIKVKEQENKRRKKQ